MLVLFIHALVFSTGAAEKCSHELVRGEREVCCDHLADKSTFQPLRIKTFWDPPRDYNATYTQFITDAIAEATHYWMSALKVHRRVGNLHVESTRHGRMRSATGVHFSSSYPYQYWKLKRGKTKEDFKAELRKASLCNASVGFPASMWREVTICENGKTPRTHPTKCETIPQAVGAPADLVLGIYIDECKAVATADVCARDHCGRATIGLVQICRGGIDRLFTDDKQRQHTITERKKYVVMTLLHEIAHVLAFSSGSFKLFRKPDGGPMVPRGARNTNSLQCKESRNRTYSVNYVDLIAYNILKVAPYFGHDVRTCKCTKLSGRTPEEVQECFQPSIGNTNAAPSCVFVMTTPKVKAAARKYFDCDDVEGMPLENRPTAACQIYGSHWENRAVQDEVMNPFGHLGAQGKFISTMTLALMEDSGWYTADYSFATLLVHGVHWGYKAGCQFFTQKCSENHPTPGYFCRQKEQGCSRGLRVKVGCATCQPGQTRLAEVWQYFRDPKTKCNSGVSASHCPIFLKNPMGDCRLPGLHGTRRWYGEIKGEQSFCFMSTWYQMERKYKNMVPLHDAQKPRCFEVKCAPDNQSYAIFMITEHVGKPVEVGVCSSAADTIDPRPQLAPTTTQGHLVGGSVACQAPHIVCRETNNLFNSVDFSRGPVLARGWSAVEMAGIVVVAIAPATAIIIVLWHTTTLYRARAGRRSEEKKGDAPASPAGREKG